MPSAGGGTATIQLPQERIFSVLRASSHGSAVSCGGDLCLHPRCPWRARVRLFSTRATVRSTGAAQVRFTCGFPTAFAGDCKPPSRPLRCSERLARKLALRRRRVAAVPGRHKNCHGRAQRNPNPSAIVAGGRGHRAVERVAGDDRRDRWPLARGQSAPFSGARPRAWSRCEDDPARCQGNGVCAAAGVRPDAKCASAGIARRLVRELPPYVFADELRVTRIGWGRERVELGDDPTYHFEVAERFGRWVVVAFAAE